MRILGMKQKLFANSTFYVHVVYNNIMHTVLLFVYDTIKKPQQVNVELKIGNFEHAITIVVPLLANICTVIHGSDMYMLLLMTINHMQRGRVTVVYSSLFMCVPIFECLLPTFHVAC